MTGGSEIKKFPDRLLSFGGGIMIARCAIQADCPACRPQKVADYTGDPLLGKEMYERKFPTAFYKKNLRITSSFF